MRFVPRWWAGPSAPAPTCSRPFCWSGRGVQSARAALLALGACLCAAAATAAGATGASPTQRPDLVKRLNPEVGAKRLVNLVTAWTHELKEMMGGMGINSIEAARGNRLMLRGVGLTDAELRVLGVKHAGE